MAERDMIHEQGAALPIAARSDVLVVGGGPAGQAAAIAARRMGASVTLVERYPYHGGLAAGGMVLDGQWSFASGVDVSTWSHFNVLLPQEHGPPIHHFVAVPARDYRVIDEPTELDAADFGSELRMNRPNLHRHLCNLPCSGALVSTRRSAGISLESINRSSASPAAIARGRHCH